MATTRNVPVFMNIVITSSAVISFGASRRAATGTIVRPTTTAVNSRLAAAATTSAPCRDRRTQDAMMTST